MEDGPEIREEEQHQTLDPEKKYLLRIPLGCEVLLGEFVFTVCLIKGGKKITLIAGKNVTVKKGNELDVEIIG